MPIIHAVGVRVRVIGRAIGWQAVLSEPGMKAGQPGRALKFIRPHIYGAAADARTAIQVGGGDDVWIVAGIDTG